MNAKHYIWTVQNIYRLFLLTILINFLAFFTRPLLLPSKNFKHFLLSVTVSLCLTASLFLKFWKNLYWIFENVQKYLDITFNKTKSINFLKRKKWCWIILHHFLWLVTKPNFLACFIVLLNQIFVPKSFFPIVFMSYFLLLKAGNEQLNTTSALPVHHFSSTPKIVRSKRRALGMQSTTCNWLNKA